MRVSELMQREVRQTFRDESLADAAIHMLLLVESWPPAVQGSASR